MATVGAVNHFSVQSWVVRRIVIAHARPLPRIFFSVCKENVVSLDIRTSVKLVSVVSFRLNIYAENSITIVGPEWERKDVRPHWRQARCLEKAKLGAVLPGPLPQILVDVDRSVLKH